MLRSIWLPFLSSCFFRWFFGGFDPMGWKITIELTTSWWFCCPSTSANPRKVDGSDEFQMSFQPPIWMNFQVPKGTPRRNEHIEPENDGGLVQMMFRKFPGVEFPRFQPFIFRGVCVLEVESGWLKLTDETGTTKLPIWGASSNAHVW